MLIFISLEQRLDIINEMIGVDFYHTSYKYGYLVYCTELEKIKGLERIKHKRKNYN